MTTVVLASSARLTYALMTNPSPVTVSPASGPPTVATLTFIASVPLQPGNPPVQVKRIAFTLPVGGDAVDLTEDAGSIQASVASSGPDRWQVGPGAGPGIFVVRPVDGQPVAIDEHALTITFTGIAVSRRVGTAAVKIVETTATGDPAKAEIAVAKFPAGFYAFDFTAGVPQVAAGGTAALRWAASYGSRCELLYGSAPPIDVSNVRTWTSPPLYATTVFMLHASASEGGETVRLDQSTTVTVAAPEVVSFSAVPDALDYDQPVELRWRSVDADGVYLRVGQTEKETLPAVSDPNHPKVIRPKFGQEYTLQAFKTQRDSPAILSSVHPLGLTFNALDIKRFQADPPNVNLIRTSTRVSWDVAHAKAVKLQGAVVDAKGEIEEQPQATTKYELAATWVDDRVTTQSIVVKRRRVGFHEANATCTLVSDPPGSRPDLGTFRLRVVFKVDNADWGSSVLIPGAVGKLNVWGAQEWTKTGDTTWEFSQDYTDTPKEWLSLPISFFVSSMIHGVGDGPDEVFDDSMRHFKITPSAG
jgi:hypothetical protein